MPGMHTNSINPVNRPAKFSGHLYQLESKKRLQAGGYVAVNGPHDTYGVVWISQPKQDGGFLNTIKGCLPRRTQRPIASF